MTACACTRRCRPRPAARGPGAGGRQCYCMTDDKSVDAIIFLAAPIALGFLLVLVSIALRISGRAGP